MLILHEFPTLEEAEHTNTPSFPNSFSFSCSYCYPLRSLFTLHQLSSKQILLLDHTAIMNPTRPPSQFRPSARPSKILFTDYENKCIIWFHFIQGHDSDFTAVAMLRIRVLKALEHLVANKFHEKVVRIQASDIEQADSHLSFQRGGANRNSNLRKAVIGFRKTTCLEIEKYIKSCDRTGLEGYIRKELERNKTKASITTSQGQRFEQLKSSYEDVKDDSKVEEDQLYYRLEHNLPKPQVAPMPEPAHFATANPSYYSAAQPLTPFEYPLTQPTSGYPPTGFYPNYPTQSTSSYPPTGFNPNYPTQSTPDYPSTGFNPGYPPTQSFSGYAPTQSTSAYSETRHTSGYAPKQSTPSYSEPRHSSSYPQQQSTSNYPQPYASRSSDVANPPHRRARENRSTAYEDSDEDDRQKDVRRQEAQT